jgi:hypothetical protein
LSGSNSRQTVYKTVSLRCGLPLCPNCATSGLLGCRAELGHLFGRQVVEIHFGGFDRGVPAAALQSIDGMTAAQRWKRKRRNSTPLAFAQASIRFSSLLKVGAKLE